MTEAHALADTIVSLIAGFALGLAIAARWRVRELERTTRELKRQVEARLAVQGGTARDGAQDAD